MNDKEQGWWTRYPPEFYALHGMVCGLALSVILIFSHMIFG
jgi:hypothetical protein